MSGRRGEAGSDSIGYSFPPAAPSATVARERLPRRGPYRLPLGRYFVACAVIRLVWGLDVYDLYDCRRRVAQLGDLHVAEVPASGVAARLLQPGVSVCYVAGDMDPRALRRARRRARRRGLSQARTVHADLSCLPFADGEVDVFLCFNGIQWASDREAAFAEIARCLAPGGRLIGLSFFPPASIRGRLLSALASRFGCPAPPGREELFLWMREAGLIDASLFDGRGFGQFNARKPDRADAA